MATVKIQTDDQDLLMNPENNDGPVLSKMGNGMTLKVPYGKDNSLYAGGPKDEQINDDRFGGGDDNLSHTISGSKANQGM